MKPRATLLTVNHAVTGLLDWQPMIPTGYRIRDQLPRGTNQNTIKGPPVQRLILPGEAALVTGNHWWCGRAVDWKGTAL